MLKIYFKRFWMENDYLKKIFKKDRNKAKNAEF